MRNSPQPLTAIQPRKAPVQARSRDRFERILDVAVNLVAEKGIDAVTMSEIAGAAEISIASLYQYFPDKAAIIATLTDRYNCAGQACVRTVFASVSGPADMGKAMHEMIESYYEFFCTVPGGHAVWQASQSDKRLQAMDAEDQEVHANTIGAAFRKIMPEMPDAETLCLGRLFTGIIGTTVRAATTMKPREARAMIDICKTVALTPGVERAMELGRSGVPR